MRIKSIGGGGGGAASVAVGPDFGATNKVQESSMSPTYDAVVEAPLTQEEVLRLLELESTFNLSQEGDLTGTADAPPAWVSVSTNDSNSATVTSITFTAPTGIVDDGVLVAFIFWGNGPGTITPPTGFVLTASITVGAGTQRLHCYTKRTSGESGDYAFSWTTARVVIGEVHFVSGVTVTGFINTSNTSTGSAADPVAPSVTTTVDRCLILACATSASSTGPTSTPPAGWTERSDHPVTLGLGQSSATKVQGSPGATGTATFDFTNAVAFNYVCITVAIAPRELVLAA